MNGQRVLSILSKPTLSMTGGATAGTENSPSSYRYAVLLIGFVTLAGCSILSGCFGVFYQTLVEAFAWKRASGASPYAVNMLVSILSAPALGWLLDRYGPRWVFTGAALLSGSALIACSTLQTLGHFVLYYGVLNALGQTALGSVAVVIARWFAPPRRGRAIALADVGTGLGMVLGIPGTAWLISTCGWRQAFVILGSVIMVLLVPLNLWQRPPPPSAEPAARRGRLGGIWYSRPFWMLCLAHGCMTVTMTMVNVHLVPFLVSSGRLELLGAASIASAVSLVSLGGRVCFGWLVDRLHGEGAFSLAMSCTITGYAMLLILSQASAAWPLSAFVLLYGFAQGAGGIAIAAKTAALFHGPALGTIFMLVNLSGNLGAALGAWCGGRLFDLSASYTLTFTTAMVSGILAISCMWLGRQPEPLTQEA
jgi:predicted MFS family arabinose efflux permease